MGQKKSLTILTILMEKLYLVDNSLTKLILKTQF